MNTSIDGKLYNVTLQGTFKEATTSIKFPSLFFLQWKTNDHKHITQTGKYSPQNQKITFDQTVSLTVPVTFQKSKKAFLKKQTQVQLNLLSKNRPDQPKLVGRITIDVSTILNNGHHQKPAEFPLQFCSVNASLTASFKVIEKVETDIEIHQLQKSIGDGISFNSTLKVVTQNASSGLDKSRESVASNYVLEKQVVVKKDPSASSSPKNSVQSREQDKKYISSIGFPDILKDSDKRSEAQTISVKGGKLSQILEGSNKKSGSILSQDTKLAQENIKLKVQVDALRLQIERQHQDHDKLRDQLEKQVKQGDYHKFELKQRQNSLDQSSIQINSLKSQSTRLREEVATLRQEGVSSTLKMAEMKDNYNRVSAKLSTAETQMKRFEGIGQQSVETKRELSSQIIELQGQINQYQSTCHSLDKQKAQLQSAVKQKTQMEQKLYRQNQNLALQLGTTTNQLKAEKQIKQSYEARLSVLEEDIKRLVSVEQQYDEAKNTWQISQGLSKEESSRKEERLNQLQDTLITMGDRVRYLQGQNDLLTQNSKRSREDYLRLEEQKQKGHKEAEDRYSQCFQQLQEGKRYQGSLQEEKNSLQDAILTLNQKIQSSEAQNIQLLEQYNSLQLRYQQCSVKQEEGVKKCTSLEDLILSANEQKERLVAQAADRQRSLQIKIMEFQAELQASNEQITMLDEKAYSLDQQIKGRQELISRLQEGLNIQIERTEELNGKLMTYFEKDDKLKDLTLVIEDEQNRIAELLVQQQNCEYRAQRSLRQRQECINDLVKQLQALTANSKELQDIIGNSNQQIKGLTFDLDQMNKEYDQLRTHHEQNERIIQQLQEKIALQNQDIVLMQAQKQQNEQHHKADVECLQREKGDLSQIISELQLKIDSLNGQLHQKEGLILQQNQKLTVKQQEINKLNDTLIELNHKISIVQQQKTDLQGQLILKEQMLLEQSNRFSELQLQHENLSNDQATFDMVKHRQEMKEKNQTIKTLQSQMIILGNEASKIPNLERTIKIKTIELNSMKFKGKVDPSTTNELIKLKDEEITSLLNQKEHLLSIEREFLNIQREMSDLRTQVELVQEQKFNIESLANERALSLEEAQQQNRKLVDEITIIGQKHGELEKAVFDMTSADDSQGSNKAQSRIRAENLILQQKVKDYDTLKVRVNELQEVAKCAARSNTEPSNKLTSNPSEMYAFLKKLLEERARNKLQEKILQALNKSTGKQDQKGKHLEEKTRSLSKDFARLKGQLLKAGENRGNVEKPKMLGQIKSCQTTLSSMVAIFD